MLYTLYYAACMKNVYLLSFGVAVLLNDKMLKNQIFCLVRYVT